jgi:HEAT repeat protein
MFEVDKVEELIGLLIDSVTDVREKAVMDLGELKNARAVEPLIRTLNDECPQVRRAAVEALGKIGDASAVEYMAETYLGKGPSHRIDIPVIDSRSATKADKEFVAKAILQIGTKVIDALIDTVENKGGSDYRYPANSLICWEVALLALWMLPDKVAVATIEGILSHNDNSVRLRFVEFLSETYETRATDLLAIAIGDSDPEVRITCVKGLGKRMSCKSKKALFKALGDENNQVRQMAMDLLTK